jgi:hypothetical protein
MHAMNKRAQSGLTRSNSMLSEADLSMVARAVTDARRTTALEAADHCCEADMLKKKTAAMNAGTSRFADK